MKKSFLFVFIILISFYCYADIRLPKLFTDHMVLQRNKPINVWGWANASEKITVQFNHQTKTTTAAENGKWMVQLDAENAGGPFVMNIKAKNAITINDVLVGEVWVCSGQSNMEFTVRSSINAQQEMAAANYPMIHHFLVEKDVSAKPLDDIKAGDWKVCSPETVGDFTAVGFYFARELYNQLKVPIGLIHTSWGGTESETWTSREAFESSDEFKNMIAGMPSLNLDSLAAIRLNTAIQKIQQLQPGFNNAVNEEALQNIDYDNSKWPMMNLPGLWEDKGLAGVDGIVWFRKEIIIDATDAGKPAVIELAMIDDNDIAYVNGTKVGSTNAYNAKRKYTIPAGVLKAGKNIIAVRVEDTGGGGGVYGDSADMKITVDNKPQSLAGQWFFQVAALAKGNASVGPNDYPTLLFNAMINPLIPYTMQGVLWYQGEANAERAYEYRKAFPLMITDWRKHWNEGDFPFYFVQLASFNAANGDSKNGSSWAELREAQTMTLSLPNTGMAVTTDIGESNDIHPKNKQDVGKRLAAIALHNVYNKPGEYSGPMYASMQTDSNKVILSFTHTGGGLTTKDKSGDLTGFEIASADKQFHNAKAYIQNNKVVVYADEVTDPVAVRFGWADDAKDDNLYNKEGFPASPFRTDNWKGITEDVKFTIQ
jgi:sialate O-acetylesterase